MVYSIFAYCICARRLLAMCVFLYFFLSALFFAYLAEAAPALSSARIVYTADTSGYLHPCATCGNTSQGGLARRSALVQTLVAGHKHPLVIAGPNEFADDSRRMAELPPDEKIRALHGAFSRMPYTAVYISSRTAEAFVKLRLPALPRAVAVREKPITEYYRAGNLTVACVFFPAGAPPQGNPSQEQLADVMRAAATATQNASLVIGVSPWGMHLENTLMGGPVFERFQAIFGSGTGVAVPGQAMNSHGVPGPLWIRADKRGRAVNVLDIYDVPAGGSAWLDGIHFSSRLVFLEKDLPEDEEVLKIISAVPNE